MSLPLAKPLVKESIKKSLKWIIPAGSFGLVVLLLLIICVPINGKSLLSRGLDKSGNHLTAFALEQAYKGKIKDLPLQNILNTQSSCKGYVDAIKTTSLDATAGSFESSFEATSLNSSAKNDFNIESTLKAGYDIKALEANLDASIKAKFNVNTVQKISDEMKTTNSGSNDTSSPLPKWGQSSVETQVKTIINKDTGFVSIPKVELATAEFTSNNKLNNWYSQDLKYTNTRDENSRQEGLKELREVLTGELRGINPQDSLFKPFTDDYLTDLCNHVGEIKVSESKSFTLGNSLSSQTLEAREITVPSYKSLEEVLKSSSQKNNTNITKSSLTAAKAKYGTVVKIIQAINKILPQNNGVDQIDKVPTQKEFEEGIDKAIAEMEKGNQSSEETQKSLQESLDQINKYIEVSIDPNHIYFDTNTGELAGTQGGMTIKPKAELLKDVESSTARTLLQDGIRISGSNWNFTSGRGVKPLEFPTNTKSISDFTKDISNTDIGKRVGEQTNEQTKKSTNDQKLNPNDTLSEPDTKTIFDSFDPKNFKDVTSI